jgi:hypothetical protein
MDITEATFAAATRLGSARRQQSPGVVQAFYDEQAERVVIELNTGLVLTFRPQDVEGLSAAPIQALGKIQISPSGLGVHFPELDVDLYIPALLQGFLGTQRWMAAQLGKSGGLACTPAKAAAARANGKLGGRPKKIKLAEPDPS